MSPWVWDTEIEAYRLADGAEVVWIEGSNPHPLPRAPTRPPDRQQASAVRCPEDRYASVFGAAVDDRRPRRVGKPRPLHATRDQWVRGYNGAVAGDVDGTETEASPSGSRHGMEMTGQWAPCQQSWGPSQRATVRGCAELEERRTIQEARIRA
jgi:hypothetical protein